MIGIDIEMPKSCVHCKCVDHDREICALTERCLIGVEYWTGRLPDCPLIDLDGEKNGQI